MKKSLALLSASLMLTLAACGGSSKASTYSPAPVPQKIKVSIQAYKTLPSYILKNENQKRRESAISVTLSTPTGIVQNDFREQMKNKEGGSIVSYNYAPGSPVSLSVQNKSTYGSVTCVISIDGKIVSENASGSDYGIATCSAVAR